MMENLKTKVIGVLREREEGNNNKALTGATTSGASGVGGGSAMVGGGGGAAAGAARQLPKMSALDLAGILNCRRRLEWTKEWLKKNQTEFLSKENLLKDMQFRKNETYHLNCFLDITERQFRHLITALAPVISAFEPHRKKKAFSAEERLAITLKYLATGEVHSCRNYCFRASKTVILKMIADICLNMYELLRDQFLALPKTDTQWQQVANEFRQTDKLPNCLGNLCMQQMCVYVPATRQPLSAAGGASNGLQLNAEPDFVPPLLFSAIIDANNNFMYVNVERSCARAPDDIYEQSTIRRLIEEKQLSLPLAVYQEGGAEDDNAANTPLPYYFAGNGALPAKPYLLESPFYVPTSRDLSYTWSAGPSTPAYHYAYAMDVANFHTENALRVLSNIFPILAQPLKNVDEENARKLTLGCVALYNFLRKSDGGYFKQTEKMNTQADEIEEDVEDDDCILLANEEEKRERDEYTPRVSATSCFQQLRKQRGETAAGLARRERLMKHIAAEHAAAN